MEFKSSKGGAKFTHDGYVYHFDRYSADGTVKFWRCEQRLLCKARLHTSGESEIKTFNVHTHDSDVAKSMAKRAVAEMKSRAASTMESTAQVLNSAMENLEDCVLGVMPRMSALKKTIQNARKQLSNVPPLPSSLELLEIPDEYQYCDVAPGTREKFLLADSGPGQNRILIFGRQRNVEILTRCSVWYVDGTFSLAPKLFYQVFVILGERYGGVHPLLYALLPNKSGETYKQLFTMVKSLDHGISPGMIHIDFELATINAIREVFPGARLGGCFFHLMRNMKKKIAACDLTKEYNSDPQFSLAARMIVALAFVPPEAIEESVEALQDYLPTELQPVMDWFEDFYLGRLRRRRRAEPRFPIELWNLYQRTLEGHSRTNNHAEASHRRLQMELDVEHPSIWHFVDGLRKAQRGRDLYYESLVGGHAAPPRSETYRKADARYLNLAENFHNMDIIEFLTGIVYAYQSTQ